MTSEQILASAPTQELEPVTPDPDPLAKITLTPRAFTAVLATAAILLGLILALLPVHVAAPDPTRAGSVSCGNTIGGVEAGSVAANLGSNDKLVLSTYISTCENAISDRVFWSWPMFLAGSLVIIAMGVVRPRS